MVVIWPHIRMRHSLQTSRPARHSRLAQFVNVLRAIDRDLDRLQEDQIVPGLAFSPRDPLQRLRLRCRTPWLRAIAAIACATCVLTPAAPAAAQRQGIVLESYTEQRPTSAAAIVNQVVDELVARGYEAGYTGFGRRYEAEISRPGLTATGLPSTFIEDVERGQRAWIRGRFDDSTQILGPLIAAAHANPAGWTASGPIREQVQRALIVLALSYHRLGNVPEATTLMGEVIRSFPEASISRSAHGPEAFELYESVLRELKSAPRGKLRIRTSDPKTTIFVNERYADTGEFRGNDLNPGVYRVYVQLGALKGRTYRVPVPAGRDVTTVIDWGFDQAIRITKDWTGLLFPTAVSRSKFEVEYAARIGRHTRARSVVVIGLDTIRGRPMLVGSLISVDGSRELRRAQIGIDPAPTQERAKALASFLVGDRAAGHGLDVIVDGPIPEPAAPAKRGKEADAGETAGGDDSGDGTGVDGDGEDSGGDGEADSPAPESADGWRWGPWKFAATAAGLAGIVGGWYFVSIHGDCKTEPVPGSPCPTKLNTRVGGYVTAGAGVGLVGFGVFMFISDLRQDTSRQDAGFAVFPTSDGGMATWSRRF